MEETLHDLITNKGFDNYQNGLKARMSAYGIDYEYSYTPDSELSVVQKKGNICQIVINLKGELIFNYNNNCDKFKNCTPDDFHIMIAHAFIYLRDGNFDYHKEWYNNLQKTD